MTPVFLDRARHPSARLAARILTHTFIITVGALLGGVLGTAILALWAQVVE